MPLSNPRAWVASGAPLLAIIPSCGTSEDGPVSSSPEPRLLDNVAMEIGSACADRAREHGDPQRFDWQKAAVRLGWETPKDVGRWQFRVEFDHPRRWTGEVFRVTGNHYALVALNDGTCPMLRHRPACPNPTSTSAAATSASSFAPAPPLPPEPPRSAARPARSPAPASPPRRGRTSRRCDELGSCFVPNLTLPKVLEPSGGGETFGRALAPYLSSLPKVPMPSGGYGS